MIKLIIKFTRFVTSQQHKNRIQKKKKDKRVVLKKSCCTLDYAPRATIFVFHEHKRGSTSLSAYFHRFQIVIT